MAKDAADFKTFTMRIPKDMMIFLKKMSAEQEVPMATIMLRCLEKLRKRVEIKEAKA